MSASTARRVGSSFSRWMGMIGNSWSMAQMSGSDWNMREVAEVGVRQRPLQPLELLGHLAHLAHDLQDLLADRPEDVLGRHPLVQRQVPEGEQRQRLLPVLQRVVVGLAAGSCATPPGRCRAGCARPGRRRRAASRAPCPTSNSPTPRMFDDQHRVVGDHRPARLGDDGRVRHAGGVADLLQAEHDVVGVLLHGVVHRRGEVGLRAVVVDAQAAADVEVLQRRAQLHALDVEAARLAQRVLDRADGGDLAAQVEVQQLEATTAGRWPRMNSMASTSSRVDRPNFERSPPEASQRPEPLDASFTRMPMRGRTPIFLAMVGDQLELAEASRPR